MRKASILLLSRLHCHRPKILHHLLSTDNTSGSSFSSSSSSSSSSTLVSPPTRHSLCTKSRKFEPNPSRNIDAISEDQAQSSPKQRKLVEKSQLEEAFESATTSAEMVKAFKEMESCFDESELGLASLKVGLKLEQEGENLEMALSFAHRALNALDIDGKASIPIVMCLLLIGSVNYCLEKFDDSLAYFNRANRLLGSLEEEGCSSSEEFVSVLHDVQLHLAKVKAAMGRREEAIENFRESLKIKEVLLGKDSRELGVAYREVAEAYVEVMNFKEALLFCSRAIEIHVYHLGDNSVEVARDRRILGVIYSGMEEHEKALEQNELSRKVLRRWGRSSDLLPAEIDAANILGALGRFDVAVETLKDAILLTEKNSLKRVLLFTKMSKALCIQYRFAESKICLEHARGILNRIGTVSPEAVTEMYSEVATHYETMNEFQSAITVLKRCRALLKNVPQEQHTEANISARIGCLLLLSGEAEEAIPCLENAAESLKKCFGPNHHAIASVYNSLGDAYLKLDRPQLAAQMYAVAKDISDLSVGPYHVDSIVACQNVSKACAEMGRYSLAIEFQKKVIEAWDCHGLSAEDQLEEAHRVLEELKKKALDEVRTRELPLPSTSCASHKVTALVSPL